MTSEKKEEPAYRGVFDLSDADGVNASERLLTRLCRNSFLSLWAYPNLHTDEGFRNGVGSAKEFTDVLLVFGDDVVLFSDKHVEFNEDKPLEVAWGRWYKRAVSHSAKQLYGALSWLQRFPERIFLDQKCARPIPIDLPKPDRARYHLVAVTRGSFNACSRLYPGSLGTLLIRTDIEGDAHEKTPFTIGVVNSSKRFVHVLDEFSLAFLLTEFDTATDFIRYLTARERFLSNPSTVISAAGEEQLASAYLTTMNGDEHWFLPSSASNGTPDTLYFDESHYAGLKARKEYKEKKLADAPSYTWDALVERFIKLGDPSIAHPGYQQDNKDTEEGLRLIASESRFRRRMLVNALGEMLRAAKESGGRRARLFTTTQDPDRVYVFLALPLTVEKSLEEYRRYRVALLHAYCRCTKLRFPSATIFIGIAVDHPQKSYAGFSEDLFIYKREKLTDEERAETEKFRSEIGILGDDLDLEEFHDDEFPALPVSHDIGASQPRSNDKRCAAKREKNKKRMAKESRRKNRKHK